MGLHVAAAVVAPHLAVGYAHPLARATGQVCPGGGFQAGDDGVAGRDGEPGGGSVGLGRRDGGGKVGLAGIVAVVAQRLCDAYLAGQACLGVVCGLVSLDEGLVVALGAAQLLDGGHYLLGGGGGAGGGHSGGNLLLIVIVGAQAVAGDIRLKLGHDVVEILAVLGGALAGAVDTEVVDGGPVGVGAAGTYAYRQSALGHGAGDLILAGGGDESLAHACVEVSAGGDGGIAVLIDGVAHGAHDILAVGQAGHDLVERCVAELV